MRNIVTAPHRGAQRGGPSSKSLIPDPRVQRDLLDEFTDGIRLRTELSGVFRLSPPFATTMRDDGLHIIIVTQGEMHATFPGRDTSPIHLRAGDVLIVTAGGAYRLQSSLDVSPSLEMQPSAIGPSSIADPDGVEFLSMVCQGDGKHPSLVTDFLPTVVHMNADTPESGPWAGDVIALFRSEHDVSRPGRHSFLSRIAELVCVQVSRYLFARAPRETKGWEKALDDERIELALRAIHRDPARGWTVESLAREAGMSRTAFATRFKLLVGESPMEYLTRWRMNRAANLLNRGASNLKAIVEASGYKSASAFRRHFKRRFGVLPGDYRKDLDGFRNV
jgi:AraC-like DNA-binding protein